MDDKKVKGSMLRDYVRMIRGNKDKDWDKHLEPEDWKTINSLILSSKWYPLEIYQRCGQAVFKELGQGNLEAARFSGKIRGKEMFENIYHSIVAIKDPMTALNQFVTTYGTLFNFSTLKFEKAGENHARVHHDYDPKDESNISYCHQLMGMFDTLVEMTGGKNAKIELDAKQWESAPATVFDITWE